MDIETLREYCLSLPGTSEDMAFGDDHLLFRVCGKIFACMDLARNDCLALKCKPDYAVELREHHPEIEPAWHWNKKYWNQLSLHGGLRASFIEALVRHSYSEVVRKLPKSVKAANPEVVVLDAGFCVD